MSKLLDKKVNGKYPFSYVRAAETDLARTFKRIREANRNAMRSVTPISTARRKHG
jgi:hypothetical protein